MWSHDNKTYKVSCLTQVTIGVRGNVVLLVCLGQCFPQSAFSTFSALFKILTRSRCDDNTPSIN